MSDSDIVMFMTLAFFICVVNVIFIALVCQRGSVKKLPNALLISFGLSDFCVGIAVMPASILCSLEIVPGCYICLISFVLYRFMNISSAINLLAVIYERYLKIVHPFWFCRHEYTTLRSVKVVSALWLTSFAISASPFTWVLEDPACEINQRKLLYTAYFDYACSAFIILLILLMIFAFVRVFLVVRKHLRKMRTTYVSAHSHDCVEETPTVTDDDVSVRGRLWVSDFENARASNSKSSCSKCTRKTTRLWLSKQVRVILRFVAMVVMFTLVWGTYFFFSTFAETIGGFPNSVRIMIQLVHFGKSLVNPWIITVNNDDFKMWSRFWRRLTSTCRKDADRAVPNGHAETIELHSINGTS